MSIVAFSDNLFTDVGQPSNSDPKFIVHGLFGLAWYVLLATQANLIRVRSVGMHMKLGIATFIIGVGVTLSTLYVFVAVWKGWSNMAADVRANRLFLPGFALCLWLAWRWRRQPAWHKRLIVVGTFFMQKPVLDRAYDPVIMSWAKPTLSALYTPTVDEIGYQSFVWTIWLGYFLSLAVYDRKTQQRFHPVTLAGAAYFALAWLVSVVT